MSLRRCLFVYLALAGIALADEAPRLPKLKDFHLRTAIVADGKPAAVVVASDNIDRAVVARLCDAVRQAAGASLPVMTDAAAEAALADPADKRAMILLGNLMTNKVSAKLYVMELLDVDAAWPGKGGFLVQTVHNPLADGRNFISLGGSDAAGVGKAVDAFCKLLKPNGRNLSLGPLFVLESAAKGPPAISDAAIDKAVARLEGAGYRTTGARATSYGMTLRKYRTPGYAKLFRRTIGALWKDMDKLEVCDDLRTTKFLPLIWDIIEESAAFTDDDRAYISNFMYVHAHKVLYAHHETKASARPHGNNWNATGSYLAGLYFGKYYPELEISRRLMERMDRYYRGDMKHWKVSEDCPGYGDITLRANLRYARTRPDMSYFESGKVRLAADYDMLITTNTGFVSGFGDCNGLRTRYAVEVLPVAAWYYRDGSYLWWYKHCGGKPRRFMVDDLDERPPTRLLGVHPYPLDQWIYDRGGKRAMPIDKCFDKMSFRAGFDPSNQYLLLSGFSYGFHSHPDGNAIINFSDNGEVFLFDDGYMIPEMAEHNTVAVYRDGRGARLPELVQLDRVADFDSVGFSETSVAGYNRVHWTRNIVWEKERFFLVVDELEAEQDGAFAFQAFWRTKGDVRLDGRELTAEQKGSVMHLVNLSRATQSVKACHFKHPFGRKLVQTVPADLKQGQRAVIANLFYVIGPNEGPAIQAETAADGVAVVKQGDALALVGVGPCKGPASLDTDAALFHTSAAAIHAAGVTRLGWPEPVLRADKPVSIALDLVKGAGVVEATVPTRVVALGQSIEAKVGRTEFKFQPPQTAAWASALAAEFANAHQARQAAEQRVEATAPKGVRVLWQYDEFDLMVDRADGPGVKVESSVAPLTPKDVNFPIGALPKILARNGNVMFPTGKTVVLTVDLARPVDVRRVMVRSRQLRTFQGGCGVGRFVVEVSNDAFKADVRPFAERVEKTMPPQNARVDYAIDGNATSARYVRFTLSPLTPGYKVYIDSVAVQGLATAAERRSRMGVLRSMDVADLDGDGKSEVIVAAGDDAVYAISSTGKRLWRTPVGQHVYQLAARDLDGDGKAEVVAGCGDRRVYCIKADGSFAWKIAPPPRTYACAGYRGVKPFTGAIKIVFASDLDGDGKSEVCLGAGNWRVYCYGHDGKLLWDECNWAHQPTCGCAFDLDGDGVQEVLVGNDYSSAHVYHGKTGKIIGTIRMSGHAGPSAIDAADMDRDGKGDVVVGDRMGRVTFCVPWNTKARKSVELGAAITFVKIVDLDADGKAEAVVGAVSGYLYVFDDKAAAKWQRNLGEVPRDAAFADIDGDGQLELLVGCEDGRLHIIRASGADVATFAAGGWVRFVKLAELDGDPRTVEVVAGSDDGCVHALSLAKP